MSNQLMSQRQINHFHSVASPLQRLREYMFSTGKPRVVMLHECRTVPAPSLRVKWNAVRLEHWVGLLKLGVGSDLGIHSPQKKWLIRSHRNIRKCLVSLVLTVSCQEQVFPEKKAVGLG